MCAPAHLPRPLFRQVKSVCICTITNSSKWLKGGVQNSCVPLLAVRAITQTTCLWSKFKFGNEARWTMLSTSLHPVCPRCYMFWVLGAKRGQYLHSVSNSWGWCFAIIELSCLVIKGCQVKEPLQHWNQFYSASHSITSWTAIQKQKTKAKTERKKKAITAGKKDNQKKTSWCHPLTTKLLLFNASQALFTFLELIRAVINNYFYY